MQPMSERGQVVFITGASSGIGRAAALAFARGGWHVGGLARRDERLASLAADIAALPASHGNFLPAAADVRQAAEVAAAVEKTAAHFGRLDVLVANAGIGQHGKLAEADWQHLETVLRTNIEGLMHSVRACAPHLRATRGQILIVSSVVAGLHTPYTATYAASKAFVSSLAGSLRGELAEDKIAVTDVLVGRTESEFNQARLGSSQANRGGLPIKRADEVAEAMVKAARTRQERVILSLFDRVLLAGGVLAPRVLARLAARQYKPRDD